MMALKQVPLTSRFGVLLERTLLEVDKSLEIHEHVKRILIGSISCSNEDFFFNF